MPSAKKDTITIKCIAINQDIQLGSLVFFYPINSEQSVEHLAICVDIGSDNVPTLVHAVDGYLVSGVVETDMLSKYGYLIATPDNEKVRKNIVSIAKSYARDNNDPEKVPYDHGRARDARQRQKNLGLITGQQILESSERLFKKKKVQSTTAVVKWAAREDQPIRAANPSTETPRSNKGFRCAQLSCLVLQIALLNTKGRHLYYSVKELNKKLTNVLGVSMGHGDINTLSDIVSANVAEDWLGCLSPTTREKTAYSGIIPAILAFGTSKNEIDTHFADTHKILEAAPWVAKWMTPAAMLEWIYSPDGGGGGNLQWKVSCIDRTKNSTNCKQPLIDHGIIEKIINISSSAQDSTLIKQKRQDTAAYLDKVDEVLSRNQSGDPPPSKKKQRSKLQYTPLKKGKKARLFESPKRRHLKRGQCVPSSEIPFKKVRSSL